MESNTAMMEGRVKAKLDRGGSVHPLTVLRLQAGISQKELASRVGKTQPFIGKIEAGVNDINNITLRSAYQIAQALGCSVEDLVNKGALEKCN